MELIKHQFPGVWQNVSVHSTETECISQVPQEEKNIFFDIPLRIH